MSRSHMRKTYCLSRQRASTAAPFTRLVANEENTDGCDSHFAFAF
jgi:hypothetical protein